MAEIIQKDHADVAVMEAQVGPTSDQADRLKSYKLVPESFADATGEEIEAVLLAITKGKMGKGRNEKPSYETETEPELPSTRSVKDKFVNRPAGLRY